MRIYLTCFLSLTSLLSVWAIPIPQAIGLDIIKDDLSSWSNSFVINNQPVQVGLGYNHQDGTVAAGARVVPTINDEPTPISVGISTNDWSHYNYQVETKILGIVGALIGGDFTSLPSYVASFNVPISKQSGDTPAQSIGAAIAGENLKPVAVQAGYNYGQDVVSAIVSLNSNMIPDSFQVQVGAQTSKP